MQTILDFKEKRKKKVQQLGQLEQALRTLFETKRYLISIKYGNELIREVWNRFGDYSAASILRIARKLRATGEYDNNYNLNNRANMEAAYRKNFKTQC